MRRFELHREVDVSGISGTGIVAEGVMFFDGSATMRWKTKYRTTVTTEHMEIIYQVHCLNGATKVVWIDEEV